MSQTLADVFKSSCIKLAQTVIINHPYAGRVINKRLDQQGFGQYTNDQDKRTWKYYMNMAGIYHTYDKALIHKINQEKNLGLTDGIDRTKMIIRVAGDEGTVEREFTIENISADSADDVIALEYQQGTRLYNELLEVYPDFEPLIKGILHPIPLTTAVTASDFDVLYAAGYYRTRLAGLKSQYGFIKGKAPVYSSIDLIEPWEESLIEKIEEFTKTYFRQYDNRTYGLINDLYIASTLGIYALNLPTIIMNIRNELTKTREVNSNHVQFYLDSFLNVGQYIPYLTRNQYMYLYRNVEWLSANAGKEKVLNELNTYLLKERGIALIDYEVEHVDDSIKHTGETEIVFTRIFDDDALLIDTKREFKAQDIIELEKNISRDNTINIPGQVERSIRLGKDSPNSNTKTKIIETHFTTTERTSYISKEEFLFNNWAYSAIKEEYRGIVVVPIPGTTNRLQLTVKNALYLFLYCYARSALNVRPTFIPSFMIHHIPKTKREVQSKEILKGLMASKDVTQAEFDRIYNLCPQERVYSSVRNFSYLAEQHWRDYVDRNFVYHQHMSINGAAELEMLTEAMYLTHVPSIHFNISLDSWVDSLGYSISTLNDEALTELTSNIFNTVLSIDNDGIHSMENIHNALINVVRVFTSYNVQFVTKTASKASSDVGVKSFRLDHIFTDFTGNDDVHIANYPSYESIENTRQVENVYGFESVYRSSDDPANLLSQEQLRELILTEDNQGIILKGGLH